MECRARWGGNNSTVQIRMCWTSGFDFPLTLNVFIYDAYLPVVKVLPHILGNNHHQVINVVVFIRRDACTEIKYVLVTLEIHNLLLPELKTSNNSKNYRRFFFLFFSPPTQNPNPNPCCPLKHVFPIQSCKSVNYHTNPKDTSGQRETDHRVKTLW